MSTDIVNRHSLAGFYHGTACKCLALWFGTSHMALQVPMFSHLQKYLVCKIPDSLRKGEFWRLLTSKIAFLDTKDAVIAVILIYYFRTFERRFGTRKFVSYLISTFLFSTALECAFSGIGSLWLSSTIDRSDEYLDLTGILSVGPIGLVVPLFVQFFFDIPKIHSAAIFGGGFSASGKVLPYVAGLHLISTSNANLIAGVAGIISGLLVRNNFLWVGSWLQIPSRIASFFQKVFGQWIESGPPVQGMMGATLEVQRTMQMEAIEQQIMRQQARLGQRNHHRGHRAQVGQGFAERLVDQDGAWGPFHAGGRRHQQPPQAAAPSEENIRLLMDMGFSRNRVEEALRQSNNDVQLATTLLLQDM